MEKWVLIRSEVTAVKFFDGFIIAGIGGYLHIFDCKSQKLLYQQRIFNGQKIYDIIFNDDDTQVLIYGGKNIAILNCRGKFNEASFSFGVIALKSIKDWIMYAKFIKGQQIALVNMHNRISIWNINLEMLNEQECEEKCILYSAYVCYENLNDLIVLSGTVFSEVLIWKPFTNSTVIKRLKSHNGVIFSIDFCEKNGYICSTSDDRSAILWKINNTNLLEQENLDITIATKVYGHLSRIFRCKILDNYLATAGEDGRIIIWDFAGKMIKKIETHQPGPIWCLDYDPSSNKIVSGGSDSGISTFTISSKISQEILTIPNETAKFVGIVNSGNIVCFSEKACLYYYKKTEKTWQIIAKHEDLKSYAIFQVSLCKSLFALCGFQGQIYIYQEKNKNLNLILNYVGLETSRIFSFHWLTCKMFLTCQKDGVLTLLFIQKDKVDKIHEFKLPPSKERWSTCACLTKNGYLVVGNRKGDLFLYKNNNPTPVFTVKKAHCHLGVVNIVSINNCVISLGRNGITKKFEVVNNKLELVESNKTKYSWLAALEGNFLIAFSGNKLVLSDFKYKRTLFDFDCGGGHRSWSFLNRNNEILFSFVKDKVINLVEIESSGILPNDFIEGYHSKEINALKSLNNENTQVFVSGGEDTTLRINMLNKNGSFVHIQSLKVHLSSIRCIEVLRMSKNNEEYLIFSGGGRAQIVCWNLSVKKNDEGDCETICREKSSLYEEIDQELPEIRVMDLTAFQKDEKIILFSGCSDGNIKVFTVDQNLYTLTHLRTLFHKYICVTKIQVLRILGKDILLSMGTDGDIVFWDVSNIFNLSTDINTFSCFKIHDSGVNSFSNFVLNNDEIIILTGGDDNKLSLDYFRFKNYSDSLNVEKLDTFFDNSTHCAQITGAFIDKTHFVTSGIDQRIAIFSWNILNGKLECSFTKKYDSSVADLQGLQCFSIDRILNAVVFGKGLEHFKLG